MLVKGEEERRRNEAKSGRQREEWLLFDWFACVT
jgi:hypothetical protein